MLEILTTELPTGCIGEDYYVRLQAGGGEPSELSWEIEDGGYPPPDLSFGKDGILSGTPKRTENADYYFVVKNVKTGEAAGKRLRLTVIQGKPGSLRITTDSIPDVAAGVPYSFELGCSGGSPPYAWSADGLPGGLCFENGTIAGTAKCSGGSAPFTATVRDGNGSAASRFYLINVK